MAKGSKNDTIIVGTEAASVADMVQNILSVLEQGTQEERAMRTWYPTVRAECAAIALAYDVPLDVFVHAVAAISPMCPWARNMQQAINVLQHVKHGTPIVMCGGIGANVRKAELIIRTERLDILSGQKVTCFAANILGTHTDATIDTHAIKIACNLMHVKATMAPNAAMYKAAQQAYATAAAIVGGGVTPSAIQAEAWCIGRRLMKLHGASI